MPSLRLPPFAIAVILCASALAATQFIATGGTGTTQHSALATR